ncbi:MAG: aminoacyl-tRNA hydrolase [Clostridiales Family XIII bacterium]|jgi:PTH1 family peptidyl-tRNA hydrolase|nr:aminoacyl-tRNA hydrolase [Clostridiales Family XIII bacterium]
MHVIVGLGNPGARYKNTRHNIGFVIVDRLAEKNGIRIEKKKWLALVGEGFISGRKALLVKPQTYMNLSGESVARIMNFFKPGIENLTVIYDDVDIPMGRIRIRKEGGAGTHNGMRSLLCHLQNEGFPRVRVGIGRERREGLEEFVTGNFSEPDLQVMEAASARAAEAVERLLGEGVDAAMNLYNIRKWPE